MGLESIDTHNLKDVNKGFNKPALYGDVLERLAKARDLFDHVVHIRDGRGPPGRGAENAGSDRQAGRPASLCTG